MGSRANALETRHESIRDFVSRSLCDVEHVKCQSAWTLPEPWTHRTRPPLLGKPHRTRFPTAPTRILEFKRRKEQNESRQPASHTKFRTVPSRRHIGRRKPDRARLRCEGTPPEGDRTARKR